MTRTRAGKAAHKAYMRAWRKAHAHYSRDWMRWHGKKKILGIPIRPDSGYTLCRKDK